MFSFFNINCFIIRSIQIGSVTIFADLKNGRSPNIVICKNYSHGNACTQSLFLIKEKIIREALCMTVEIISHGVCMGQPRVSNHVRFLKCISRRSRVRGSVAHFEDKVQVMLRAQHPSYSPPAGGRGVGLGFGCACMRTSKRQCCRKTRESHSLKNISSF